ATEHVTFSTITSPDVPQANRYGHMPNYEDIGGGLIWLRAQLVGETTLSSGQYTPQNGINETYVGGNTTQISSLCQSLSSSMYGLNTTQPRIPVLPEARLYRDFVVAKGYSDIVSYNGWNVWSRLGTVFTFTGVLHNYGLIMTALSSSHPDYVEPFISRSSAHQTDGWAFCVANKFVPTVTTVKNTHNFAVDSGFPTTAFDGAQFKLNMSPDNAGYSFVSSDSTNAPVDGNGVITINDKPAGEVTITASKNGEADVEYSFNVDEFYSIPLLGRAVASTEAKASCSTRGLNEPTREQLASQGVKDARQVGGLFTEWGLPQQWNGWVPPTGWIWSKTVDSSGYFCGVNAFPGEGPVYGTCVPDQPGSAWVPYCYK
ncbi:hypothetical protein M2H12_22470, partial [Vibrio vulnificus]|nr:hypothetical protein [Vibrio vulnificus]MCU8173019.1 hypothetical protein [Vibrio vulnificus]